MRVMRNRYFLLVDLALIVGAAFGAFALRFDWFFLDGRPEFGLFVLVALLVKPTVLYAFGMYARYWRYATVVDLLAVVLAVSTSSVTMALMVGIALVADSIENFSRSVLLLDWLLSVALLGGLRLSVRVIGESKERGGRVAMAPQETRRVLIVGAGEAGTMVVRELQRNPQLGMDPVCFLDDDPVKVGKWIHGVRVAGNTATATLERTVRMNRIGEVVIAMPSAPGALVRTVAESCQTFGIASRTIPGVFELLDGNVSVSRLRHVEISDLLRRRQVVGTSESTRYLAGKTVLVTGAGGSIGYELCRQVAFARPDRLVMLGHGENSLFQAQGRLRESFPSVPVEVVLADVRDRVRLGRIFEQIAPDVVFHSAAHKHVHLMEANFEEAISNNIVGTRNLVEAALSSRTERFVAISTDKAVSPAGMMGASKRMASLIVHDAFRRSGRPFVVVRFGNVLGSRGSVVPVFQAQIARGGPLTVTHPDVKRFFMTIPEAAHLVLQAGGMGKGGELFVLDMGQPVRILDLAKELIRLSGFPPDRIPINMTGLRRGEKLEESLWEQDATVERTVHPEILRVTEPVAAAGDLNAAIAMLQEAAALGDRLRAEAILCDWIPTFVPSFDGSAIGPVAPDRSARMPPPL